jgi:hypothetical protein
VRCFAVTPEREEVWSPNRPATFAAVRKIAPSLKNVEQDPPYGTAARFGQHGIHFGPLLPAVEHVCGLGGRASASLTSHFSLRNSFFSAPAIASPRSAVEFGSACVPPVLRRRQSSHQAGLAPLTLPLHFTCSHARHHFPAPGCRCYNLTVKRSRGVVRNLSQRASVSMNGGMVQGSARQVLNLKTRVRFPVPLPNFLSNSSAPLRRKSCALRWAIQLHLSSLANRAIRQRLANPESYFAFAPSVIVTLCPKSKV